MQTCGPRVIKSDLGVPAHPTPGKKSRIQRERCVGAGALGIGSGVLGFVASEKVAHTGPRHCPDDQGIQGILDLSGQIRAMVEQCTPP